MSESFDSPDRRDRLDHMAQGVIGTPRDRPDGVLKVTGTAPYAAEWQAPGLCHGVLARSTIACGTVRPANAEEVRAMPGVLAVICDPRFLRNPGQGGVDRVTVQSATEVAYFGQPTALVVAESFEAARHAAQALRFDADPAPATLDPETAETERPEAKQAARGDLDRAMAEAAVLLDLTYRTPSMTAAAMEPHATLATWEDGRLTLRTSMQMLKHDRAQVADALALDPGRIRILSPFVGGGFGSKLGIAPEAIAAAIAAEALGRPVAVALTRQQMFEATTRRSETRQRIRLAATSDGRLQGIGHESLVSNLPGETFSEPVAQATHYTYAAAHRAIAHEVARVNRTAAGSVRAPGEAVGVNVFECAMDELAEACGIDPVELRLRNIPEADPEDGRPFSSHMLAEALRHGAARFGWQDRPARPGPRGSGEWLTGMGMAAAVRVNMTGEAEARVTLTPDGRARVETDMTDIGTGTYAVLTQVAAEMLGLPPERVETVLGDTDLPPGSGSGGSMGASSTGSAVFLACEELRRRLAARLGCAEDALTLKDGRAIHGNRETQLAEALGGETLTATGRFVPGETEEATRQSTYGAHFAEVAVSRATGEVRVRRMHGTFAAGRILNEKTARSQCLGGMIWGIGMALTEEMLHDPRDGHVVNRDLAGYHIPVSADVPAIDIDLLPERDPWASPMQSKGIGELGICGAAAAVLNAVHNACGVRVRAFPATPDKVLAGLRRGAA